MKWKTLENCCSKWRVEIWDLERKTLEGRLNEFNYTFSLKRNVMKLFFSAKSALCPNHSRLLLFPLFLLELQQFVLIWKFILKSVPFFSPTLFTALSVSIPEAQPCLLRAPQCPQTLVLSLEIAVIQSS